MPRIRTIKPESFQDEKIAVLDPIHRLVWYGLIAQADDAGRLLDNLKTIDAFIFPFTDQSSRETLDILARLSRVLRYTAPSGQKLLQIVNWGAHQKIDHPSKHVLPAPTAQDLARLEVTGTAECLAKSSRDTREIVAPDLGPRTLDLGPRIKDQVQDQKPLSSKSSNGSLALAKAQPAVPVLARKARDVTAVRARIAEYLDTARETTLSKAKLRALQIETVFAYWAAKHRKTKRTLLDDKREKLIDRRLRENGGDVSELLYAIDGSLRDRTLTEGGFDQLSTILRDRSQVERLAGLMPKYDAGEPHEMATKVLGVTPLVTGAAAGEIVETTLEREAVNA